jgi:hypothetical protein
MTLHPISVLPAGMAFVTDAGNARIRSINLTSLAVATVAGNGATGWSGDGGPGLEASFSSSLQVACTSRGHASAQAATALHAALLVLTPLPESCLFCLLQGLCMDNHRNRLLICDYSNNRIRALDLSTFFVST